MSTRDILTLRVAAAVLDQSNNVVWKLIVVGKCDYVTKVSPPRWGGGLGTHTAG